MTEKHQKNQRLKLAFMEENKGEVPKVNQEVNESVIAKHKPETRQLGTREKYI